LNSGQKNQKRKIGKETKSKGVSCRTVSGLEPEKERAKGPVEGRVARNVGCGV